MGRVNLNNKILLFFDFFSIFFEPSPKNRSSESKRTHESSKRDNFKKNLSQNDILEAERIKKTKMQSQIIKSKDDKIGSLLSELENANDKVKILEAENERISTNMKALEDEISSQECLVRLERGDYEELKIKEKNAKKLEKQNKELSNQIKQLKCDLLEGATDKTNFEKSEKILQDAKAKAEKDRKSLQDKLDEVTRLNEQLKNENKEIENRNYDLTTENKIISKELKNSLKANSELEKQIQKLKSIEEKRIQENENKMQKDRMNIEQLETKLRNRN